MFLPKSRCCDPIVPSDKRSSPSTGSENETDFMGPTNFLVCLHKMTMHLVLCSVDKEMTGTKERTNQLLLVVHGLLLYSLLTRFWQREMEEKEFPLFCVVDRTTTR